MLQGYTNYKQLPVIPRMKVRIPKGTILRSTHPQKDGPFKAARAQTVTVHHTLPGQTYSIGTIYRDPDGTEKVYLSGTHWRDLYHICQNLGVDYSYGSTVDAKWLLGELEKTGRLQVVERSSGNYNGQVFDVKLHTQNPSVCWAGTGGYWVEAEINDIEVIGWYVDTEGEVQDLSQRAADTFIVEEKTGYIEVSVGGYDAEDKGFRVDDSYVLHSSIPEVEAA